MDRPSPDPAKLLSAWMEWERGDTPPGRTMANLKTAGLRDLLEDLVARVDAPAAADPVEAAPAARAEAAAGTEAPAGRWTPVV